MSKCSPAGSPDFLNDRLIGDIEKCKKFDAAFAPKQFPASDGLSEVANRTQYGGMPSSISAVNRFVPVANDPMPTSARVASKSVPAQSSFMIKRSASTVALIDELFRKRGDT
jgi:hypothetical protein